MSKDWFNSSRYGLFIHWGAYSAGCRGEWFMNRELVPVEEYKEKYVNNFKAENYDPAQWAAYAKKWGMGYTVLTTRHHDGFALWDSQVNPYNSMNYGPKRDLVRPYVEAVRAAGLKLGFYYSPANWSHPDYPGSCFRDWPGENDWKDEESRQRFIQYYRAELRELLTNYGKVDYLWFDGCIPENIDGDETIKMLRELQPDMIINNRLGQPFDVKVCEQTINPPADDIPWEACMTLNQNWGYHAGDHRWKQPEDVLDLLLQCAQKGGNLLLNVGPKADGTIPEESVRILDAAGEWIKENRKAIENSERHGFTWNNTARPITRRGNMVYLHFFADPGDEFCWGDLATPVKCAYWLDSGKKVKCIRNGKRVFFKNLEWKAPCRTLAIETDGEPVENYKHNILDS